MSKPRQLKWNANDRFAFSTQRLRASTIPGRRFNGPTVQEWDDIKDEEDDYGFRVQRQGH